MYTIVFGNGSYVHSAVQALQELIHGVSAGHGADHMDTGSLAAFFFQLLQGAFHGSAGGQHGIHHQEGFSFQVRAGAVIGVHFEIVALAVLAEGGEEGAFGPVKDIQQPVLQRQAGPQDLPISSCAGRL